jgi:hypothetical protein
LLDLFKYIDVPHVRCLNEDSDHPGVSCIKPFEARNDTSRYVESDADEQLIIYIPFTGAASLRSISVFGGGGELSPAKMKAFINRTDIDFDNADDFAPTQEWDLVANAKPEDKYPARTGKFNCVEMLVLYFPSNFGAETTRIHYIGLHGKFTSLNRDIVQTVYELRPVPDDNKTKAQDMPKMGM